MRLVMMGTGPFAVPTFERMYASGHEVLALVTGPLRTRRGEALRPSAMREIAQAHGTPIFDPENVNTPEAQEPLAGLGADLLVVCDYGQILAPATLGTARLGGVNLHASLLPKYRGAAPINWAIYHGETQTGISVIHMTPRIDAGPVIAQSATAIGPDETAAELEPRLAELGAGRMVEVVDALERGPMASLPQDASLASRAPRLKKTDGLIDWSRSARAVKDHVRALEPWPKSHTFWHRPGGAPLRLLVGPVSVLDRSGAAAEPGIVLEVIKQRIVVACGQGAASLDSLQPSGGKRLLSTAEFLNGYRVEPGQRFGGE